MTELPLFAETPQIPIKWDAGTLIGRERGLAQAARGEGRDVNLTAHARRSDPDTSRIAARSVGKVKELQDAILAHLRRCGPMTDYALVETIPRHNISWLATPQNLRSRRAELVKAGLVCDTGKRELGPSGRPFVVWGLTK